MTTPLVFVAGRRSGTPPRPTTTCACRAERRQLIRLFLAEAMLLAFAGGVAALVIADWLGSALRTMLLDHVEWVESPLGGGTPLVVAGLVIMVGVAVGIIPALRGSTADLS